MPITTTTEVRELLHGNLDQYPEAFLLGLTEELELWLAPLVFGDLSEVQQKTYRVAEKYKWASLAAETHALRLGQVENVARDLLRRSSEAFGPMAEKLGKKAAQYKNSLLSTGDTSVRFEIITPASRWDG